MNHWLGIFFLIFLSSVAQGAEVQIQGISQSLRSSVEEDLDPRLAYIKQRPASSWRADDAAFFLRRILIRKGYIDAAVNPVIRGENLIILQCELGNRLLYGTVTAQPLEVIDTKQLDNYFMQPLIDREQVRRSEVPYQEDYGSEGAANVENYLKSMGYWNAQVKVAQEHRNIETKKVQTILDMRSGVLHTLSTPKLSGVSENQEEQLLKQINPLVGKTATSENIIKVQETVSQFFKKRGYQYAKIEVTAKSVKGQQELNFTIEPGEVFRIRRITIVGNKKTKTSRLERYLKHLEGGYYDSSQTSKVSSRLLRTGAFKGVAFSSKVVAKNEVDLVMEVEEDKAQLIRTYAGYGSYEKGIIGLSYSNLNIMGRLQRLNLRGEYSGRGILGEVNVVEPFLGGEPIYTEARAYVLRRLLDGYDKNESGYEVSLAWDNNDFMRTQLYGKMNYATISSVELTEAELGPSSYLNTAIGVRQTFDFRDNAILPTKGFHLLATAEFGTTQGDKYTEYFKTEINSSYRIKIAEQQGLRLAFDVGVIQAGADLPIDLKFFSGGVNSVRSFRDNYMGQKSATGYPLGGTSYWNASVQYHYDFNKYISAIGFMDSGKVLQKSGLNFHRPSVAAGLGIHLNLPIGPIRLEYGKGISNNPGDPKEEFHFTIGTSF